MSILRKIIERVAPMGPADLSRLDLLDSRLDLPDRGADVVELARADQAELKKAA